MRRAPEHGYDFGKKRDYRRRVWATFRDLIKSSWRSDGTRLAVKDAHALLMPSIEGDEIDVAMCAGFREDHLHVVDSEPAIVATLKKRYRHINTYGVTASRALDRMRRDGIRIHCANFDFCGQMSTRYAEELFKIGVIGNYGFEIDDRTPGQIKLIPHTGRGVFDDFSLVSISLLRGREPSHATESLIKWQDIITDEMIDDCQRRYDDDLQSRFHPSIVHRYPNKFSATPPIFELLRGLSPRDRARVFMQRHLLSPVHIGDVNFQAFMPSWTLMRCGSYLSTSGQTMLWAIHALLSQQRVNENTTALLNKFGNQYRPYGTHADDQQTDLR